MAAALQIWSHTFSKAFDNLPSGARETMQRKIDEMGTRLENFPHQRLQGRPEFKLRVGDYRVLYEFDVNLERIFLHYVGNRREIYKRK
ncbi:MAG: type II toxin-antitoxin system RelE family toxin [Limisphaerales bacterium]